jgi:hypothetical protein
MRIEKTKNGYLFVNAQLIKMEFYKLKFKTFMLVEKNKNGYLISTVINNRLIKMQYSFYTKKDAVKAFKEDIKNNKY